MSEQTEMTEEVIEKIAEAAPELMRSMNKIRFQFSVLGFAVGTAAGGMLAFAIAYRKAEAKYSKITDDEIEEMREHYQAKGRALEATKDKGNLHEIIKERGYSSPDDEPVAPPMVVQPPPSVVEALEDEVEGEPPDDDVEARNVFAEAEITHEWDWRAERRHRSSDNPYVIHYEERNDAEAYQDATLTYYDGDDVLCNERDEIVDPSDRDRLVGEKNLERFGHGSNDASIVYVRNDALEIIYEVVKSPNSYAEEVHGITHDAYDRGNIKRMHARERDEE